MKIVRPYTLGSGLTLISTNVAQEYSTYDPAVTYAKAARVTSGLNAFESVADGNVGNALSDAAWWLDLGASNPYRMYDQYNGTQTQNAGAIVDTLSAAGRVDTIALLNVSAASVHITMSTASDGVIYDETQSLVSSSGINTWYDYFYEPIVRKTDVVFQDVPNFANPTIALTINQPSGIAKVGVAIIGQAKDLGDVVYGAQTGIQDYSKKETDDFGNFMIVKRAYAKRGSFKLIVDNARVDALNVLLAGYRAEPILWIGTDTYASTWIYGFYRDFSVEIAFRNHSNLNLELEGLT
jgi:hypothetical protein